MLFSYLVRGTVEKLEVVNKKWVRVKTVPGASVDGGVSVQVSAFVCQTLLMLAEIMMIVYVIYM